MSSRHAHGVHISYAGKTLTTSMKINLKEERGNLVNSPQIKSTKLSRKTAATLHGLSKKVRAAKMLSKEL